MILFSGPYAFLHHGHCGGSTGYLPPNTIQQTIFDCLNECSSREDPGYFAYKTGSNCACYTKSGGCNYDGKYMDRNSYQILEPGKLFVKYFHLFSFLLIIIISKYFTDSKRWSFLVFPKCIETNKVFRASNDEIDIDQRVSKAFSADICAKKGKEESLKHHSTTKATIWSWYSTTNECVIFTFNEEPNRKLEHLSFGK